MLSDGGGGISMVKWRRRGEAAVHEVDDDDAEVDGQEMRDLELERN